MQSSILYYDKKSEEACYDICRYLKIDNMPAIDGTHYYEQEAGIFIQKSITIDHSISVSSSIFRQEIIPQFEVNRHNVLFVFEEDVMMGVVHICDYNRDIVLQYIQDDILSFERKLRQLILLHGYDNTDILNYFIYKREKCKDKKSRGFYDQKIQNYESRRIESDSLGAFQLFDFSDLLNFTESSFTNSFYKIPRYSLLNQNHPGKEILRELRNLAMHGKNPVKINNQTFIYSLDSLQKLIDSLYVLRKEYSVLTNKIRQHPDFIRSIELDNRSKLDIIHHHHPKALEYFLGF